MDNWGGRVKQALMVKNAPLNLCTGRNKMKTVDRILKALLCTGFLFVMSCVIPMVFAVFLVLEGLADQAYAAKVSGTVFNDANQNGVLNTGETGVSGVTVTLDGSITRITTGAGTYTFNSMSNGAHTLSVANPLKYFLTTNNNPYTFNLQGTATVNFGYAPITTTTTTV